MLNEKRQSNVIFDALRVLVALVQFKKREKYQWRSVTFSKVADLVPNHAKRLIWKKKLENKKTYLTA